MTLAIAKLEQGAHETVVSILSETNPTGFYACEGLFDGQRYTIHRQQLYMIENELNIPSRFSLRAFERVAFHIGHALAQWPEPLTIRTDLSSNTLARCIQEALTAKRRFNYRHSSIDERKWMLYNANLATTRTDAHTLLLGPRDALRSRLVQIGVEKDVIPEIEVSPAVTTLTCLCQLITTRALHPQPCFFVRGSTDVDRASIEASYDVVFTPDEIDKTKHYIT